jgi:hypothetical protein
MTRDREWGACVVGGFEPFWLTVSALKQVFCTWYLDIFIFLIDQELWTRELMNYIISYDLSTPLKGYT